MATTGKQPAQTTSWVDDDRSEEAADDSSPFVASFAAFVFALGFLALALLGLFVDSAMVSDDTARGTVHNAIHWLLIGGAIASLACLIWTVVGLAVSIHRSRRSRPT